MFFGSDDELSQSQTSQITRESPESGSRDQSCTQCGSPSASLRDGLCGACRLRSFNHPRKYVFTEDLLAELRFAYAGGRPHITRSLNKLVARTGWPRQAFTSQAMRMGLATSGRYRRWTAQEDEYLRENLGVLTIRTIAKSLGRSHEAVEGRGERLALSRRVAEGYNVSDLALVFGVHWTRAESWIRRGLLGKVHQRGGLRVMERNVVRFLRTHPHEYDLRKVDQRWFKGMLFGSLADCGEDV
jgi:hypothetical protein